MQKNKLWSIILTHFNQFKYIFEAIDSILIQDYKNIELIICDDFSIDFDSKKVLNYINKKKNDNIKNIEIVINKQNIGTVKTLNKALKIAKGEYIYIFAADDVLYNSKVISNMNLLFEKENEINCISSICLLCDEKLNGDNKFPHKENIEFFNKLNTKEQNKLLKKGPIFAPGATAYRKSLFENCNYMDEKYHLIEDWSWFLKITRLNNKILLIPNISLKHRGGGISESFKIPKGIIKDILNDTYNIYNNEVFNDLSEMSVDDKNDVFNRYKLFINMYNKFNLKFFLTYYFRLLINMDLFLYKLHFVLYRLIYLLILLLLFIVFIILYKYISPYLLSVLMPIFYIIIVKELKRRNFLK